MNVKLSCGSDVLILAMAFPPETLSGSKRPFRMAKYLPGCGYPTHVITASRESHMLGWRNVHIAPASEPVSDVVRASHILEKLQRHFLPYNDRLPWIPHAVAAAEEAMRGGGVGAVLSTSPPIGSHFAAAELKRRHGVKWIADFRDPLYGNPWRQRRLAWIYDSALERYIIRGADVVIANTDTAGEMLRKRYPQFSSKIFVLWNGYDPDDCVEALALEPREYRVLAHVGALGGGRHPGLLLDSMVRLIARGAIDPNSIRLRFVGSLEANEPWLKQASYRDLASRGCLEAGGQSLPEPQARRVIATSDYLLLLDLNSTNTALQLPAKLFDYVRVGRPILAFTLPGSPAEKILSRSDVRHVCVAPTDSPDEMDAKIRRFFSFPSDPVVASAWFWKTFGAQGQAQFLASLLDKAMNRSVRSGEAYARL